MSRTLKKIAFGLTAMLVVASGIGYLMRAELSARYTAYQLRSTNDESTRQALAGDLVSCGVSMPFVCACRRRSSP